MASLKGKSYKGIDGLDHESHPVGSADALVAKQTVLLIRSKTNSVAGLKLPFD